MQVNNDTTTRSQFFSAVAIDPTNGTVDLAWYDARTDRKNQKVDVYFQSYSSAGVPSGGNVKVTTATSDESNPKTNNPNQYGDYMGIAAYGGFAFPVWTDHRTNKSGTEQIYVDPPLPIPGIADATAPAAVSVAGAVASVSTPGEGAATSLAVPLSDLPQPASTTSSWLALLAQAPTFDGAEGTAAASTPTTNINSGTHASSREPSSIAAAGALRHVGPEDVVAAPLDAELSLDGSGNE